jgi:hypothetical protein
MTHPRYTHTGPTPVRTDGESRYSPAHRAVLLAAAEDGREHFRPGVVTARLGLSLAEGQRAVLELIEMGFVERERARKPYRLSPYEPSTYDGRDEGGYYYIWQYEDTVFCLLTEDGHAEVERLRKQAEYPATLREYSDEVARLRADVERLENEARVLCAEDQRLLSENEKLKEGVRRLRAWIRNNGGVVTCRRCAAATTVRAKFCPRCGARPTEGQRG